MSDMDIIDDIVRDHDPDCAEDCTDCPPKRAPEKEKTFTCNDCGTSGSLLWMGSHPCGHNSYVNENGGRCEDYPCCGHTDGDGCASLETHTSDYWRRQMDSLSSRGYDDYEIDMILSREDQY